MGAVVGYGVALQASCLEGFDSLGLHQFKDTHSNVIYDTLVRFQHLPFRQISSAVEQ